jgi:hypothetical protein
VSRTTLALLLALAIAPSSHACSCMRLPSNPVALVNHALEWADFVFLGEVLSIAPDSPHAMTQVTRISVVEAWKGQIAGIVESKIFVGCCMCGFAFGVGAQYLIFATRSKNGFMHVSVCSGTDLAERRLKEIKYLRTRKALDPAR